MATLAALSDELTKIAEDRIKEHRKKRWDSFKRHAKTIAGVSVGYGLGHGAGMLAEKALEKKFGRDAWRTMPLASKMRYLKPALGIATGASYLAATHLKKKMQKSTDG